jgi:DNA-binding transcriptional ArsR family regulator
MLGAMSSPHSLANVASLVGEPTRAAILLTLLEGRCLPAGELARAAKLSAAATSLHLAKLVQGGLLSVQKAGRHRLYRLASSDVAHALEALGVLATHTPLGPALTPVRAALREARTCYDHLAGSLAVTLAQKLEESGLLLVHDERTYQLSAEGERWFTEHLQLSTTTVSRGRRQLARRCLDWTERRPHLAGALGAALLDRVLELRWVARVAGSRALTVTPLGRARFKDMLTQQAHVVAEPRAR